MNLKKILINARKKLPINALPNFKKFLKNNKFDRLPIYVLL